MDPPLERMDDYFWMRDDKRESKVYRNASLIVSRLFILLLCPPSLYLHNCCATHFFGDKQLIIWVAYCMMLSKAVPIVLLIVFTRGCTAVFEKKRLQKRVIAVVIFFFLPSPISSLKALVWYFDLSTRRATHGHGLRPNLDDCCVRPTFPRKHHVVDPLAFGETVRVLRS